MELNNAFSCFVNWILKYKDNFKLCTPTMVGSYKRSFKADTKVLVASNNSTDFTKENFFDFLQNIIFDFNEKVLNSDIQMSNQLIENFPVFLDLLATNKLSGVCGTDENFKLEEGVNLLLLTIIDTFNSKVKSSNINQNELEALRIQISQLQQTNNNSVSQQASIEKKLPQDFKEAYRIFQIQFEKLLINENQISLFKTHQLNQTVPPSLLWTRFPQPMLPFNKEFVDEHNKLISDFQLKNIELCIKYCQIRIGVVKETLSKYKNNYPNEENIDTKLDKIKEDTERLLQKKFGEDHRVISNYTPVCRKVSSKINPNDSSFENKNPYKNQRDKRDRSQHNNSSIRYYNRSNNKKSRGSNHNNNNSRNSINSNVRGRNNFSSTPNNNRHQSNTYSRSNSQTRT